MLVIGLTGGIGSGKSTVARLFAKKGIPVIDCDAIAKDLTQNDSPYLEKIRTHFGDSIIDENGELKRKALGKIIFNNEDEKKWLEELLHPGILAETNRQIAKLDAEICLVEVPLLFESTLVLDFIDRILVVDVPEGEQLRRTMIRDHLPRDLIENIMKNQVSREYRLEHADDVIDNHGSLEDLEEQVAHYLHGLSGVKS